MNEKVLIVPKKKSIWQILWSQRVLLLMSVPLVLHRLLFSYVPLYGWTMAFQRFRPHIRSVWEQEWVGLDHFEMMFVGPISDRFWRAVVNSLGQSFLMLVTGTLAAIALSLLLNELKQIGIKRIYQSILYMPFFLSMVIIANLAAVALTLPQSGGVVNSVLLFFRIIDEPILFLADARYFWGIMVGINLWRTLGWGTIIYLAAMTGIDPELYEAAEVDGANRYKKMWYITLPGIKSTAIVLLIMNLGWILNAGFDLQWFLGNGLNMPRSEILDIFILRFGIEMGNFSLATAAGIFRTVVSVTLVASANYITKLLGEERLY